MLSYGLTGKFSFFVYLFSSHNTYEVFGDYQENTGTMMTNYGSQFVRHNVPPTEQRVLSAGRKNKPQPTSATFLRQNPRFTCEPICHVSTTIKETAEFHPWWPNELPEKKAKVPKYSLESTSRFDYQKINQQKVTGRYTSNSLITESATGIVPSPKTPKQTRFSEKISYEHQYNSRLDPNEPIRGKRHGSFVWRPTVSIPTRNNNNGWTPSNQVTQGHAQTLNYTDQETARTSLPNPAPVQRDSHLEITKNKAIEELSHVTRESTNQPKTANGDQNGLSKNCSLNDNILGKGDITNNTKTVPDPLKLS